MARPKNVVALTLKWTAVLVAFGALFWFSLNSLHGLAGIGLLPAAALGTWLAIASTDSGRRAWWLGWTATVGAAIPSCPFWNGAIPAAAWWLSQRLSSVPWNYLELAALLLSPLLPLTVVGAVGMVVGSLTTYLFRRSPAAPQSGPLKWRFSLRELMVTIAVFGFVLGWNMEWIRRRQDVRQANQLAFLERFKTSFTSGEVQLLRDPELEGAHRSATSESGYRVFHTPGISEYRITAPIREAGKDKWALWSYTCGPDNSMGGEHVFQFGYAEAARKSQVPAMPLPLKRYVQYSPRMIDGFPSTAGPAATVISSPASLAVDQPLVIKASAPAGTTCRLVLLPADAAATPLVDQKPDAKRAVEWSVMIQPGYAGGSIRVEVECIEARGKHSFKNSTPAPNVRLLPATQLK